MLLRVGRVGRVGRFGLLDDWKQYGAAGHLCVRGRNRTVFLQFTKEVWN